MWPALVNFLFLFIIYSILVYYITQHDCFLSQAFFLPLLHNPTRLHPISSFFFLSFALFCASHLSKYCVRRRVSEAYVMTGRMHLSVHLSLCTAAGCYSWCWLLYLKRSIPFLLSFFFFIHLFFVVRGCSNCWCILLLSSVAVPYTIVCCPVIWWFNITFVSFF